MASSSSRHRREKMAAAAEEYYADDGGSNEAADSATTTTEEEEEEDHRLHLELDSMTAKGIQHLCSELLEINKASEHDFRANVYLSYLSFIRMFQEADALEKDLHQHVLGHRRLLQHLSNNYLDSSSMLQVLGAAAATIPVAPDHYEEELELELELDVLLSEHRMEEALELLELQGQAALHCRITTTAEAIASSMSAQSSSWKARVADRFASVAGNHRTPRPELLKALSGLCRLGEAERANHLLFKFYRPATSQPLFWKKSSSSSSNYIKDLARTVFSSVAEASRSFVSLHGHPSPHTPQLIRWAREEMEDFSVAFSEYVKSSSVSRALALEAAKCALSACCSLLRPLHVIVSEEEEEDLLLDLMAPFLQEVLTMYARHLKEVTRLFVASDTWVLGRFPVSGILVSWASRSAMAAGLQIEYCLLTTSGRKLLTLIQDVVEEDVYPLLDLGINNPVLRLVAELFSEYMRSIVVEELTIPTKRVAPIQNEEEDHRPPYTTWQLPLSVLINCTSLVSLFPVIAHGIMFDDDKSEQQPSEVSTTSARGGEQQQLVVDGLISLVKEAAGQVWACFCQRFIRDTMSSSSSSCLQKSGEAGRIAASSPQLGSMMPSFPFQVLFGRVRQLNSLYGTILSGKDGTMRKLLQELMEATVSWLSNNLDSIWIHHAQQQGIIPNFHQIQLDVHFLLEFARVGGFSSESIRTGALELLTKAEGRVVACCCCSEQHGDRGWATDAAKHAVGVLMTMARQQEEEEEEANVQIAREEGLVIEVDHETGARCDYGGGKSSDEFISIDKEEEEEEEDSMCMSSEVDAEEEGGRDDFRPPCDS